MTNPEKPAAGTGLAALRTDQPALFVELTSTAVISPDGQYRYRLGRTWGSGRRVAYVMLNPSTADATVNDQTIKRCMFYARSHGYDGIDVVNLFAYRATDPKELGRSPIDVVGPANNLHIRDVCAAADRVVVAWGASPFATTLRVRVALNFIRRPTLWCLGATASGAPRHPSRLGNVEQFVEWVQPCH